MGLFKRDAGRSKTSEALQYPDQLGREGDILYGTQKFKEALGKYESAIDKLHTMYVMTPYGSRRREPSLADGSIIDGFVSSLGASRALDSAYDPETEVQHAIAYLTQIAQLVENEGGNSHIYRDGVDRIQRALRYR